MLNDLAPVILRGEQVYVEPLEERHAGELFAIGQDEATWQYMPRGPIQSEEDARRFIARALSNRAFGREFAFAIRLCTNGALIGSSRFQDIQPQHDSIEIGWTFIHSSHGGRGAGTESQFLLGRHAFEDLGAGRVWFKTDARNLRMQQMLERCGVTREGVLRRHMRARDGFIRDSVMYSILREEYPAVRQRFEEVLADFSRRPGMPLPRELNPQSSVTNNGDA
jgi:N-acetyltransferase